MDDQTVSCELRLYPERRRADSTLSRLRFRRATLIFIQHRKHWARAAETQERDGVPMRVGGHLLALRPGIESGDSSQDFYLWI